MKTERPSENYFSDGLMLPVRLVILQSDCCKDFCKSNTCMDLKKVCGLFAMLAILPVFSKGSVI